MSIRVAILTALFALQATSIDAVLIDVGDGTGNTRAPAPDPGWDHIGVGNGLSVIYLGDGWVLSAAHVGEITVAIDGEVYPPVVGSRVVLEHAAGDPSDVEVFRIEPFPRSKPRLAIRETPVPVDELVLMVGNGRNRGGAIAWPKTAGENGYAWGARKSRRWGTNRVAGADLDAAAFGQTTHSFVTRFEPAATPAEAQATLGDSGGPVFTSRGPGWELAGIIYATREWPGQPAETSVYGNLTFAADLSYYHTQILEVMTPACGNGHLTIDEQCDDGNTRDGDCCSAACRFEDGGTACDNGLFCDGPDVCNGRGACTPTGVDPCDDFDVCTEDTCSERDRCANVFVSGPSCVVPAPPGDGAPEASRPSRGRGGPAARVHLPSAAARW